MQKMAGGVIQVVEHLPSKCEALSSNSKTTKKKIIIITARAKWTGGVTQEVQSFCFAKYQARSSNPSPIKNKTKN
jgi:hypothetical protein